MQYTPHTLRITQRLSNSLATVHPAAMCVSLYLVSKVNFDRCFGVNTVNSFFMACARHLKEILPRRLSAVFKDARLECRGG